MKRRDFFFHAARGLGAAWIGSHSLPAWASVPTPLSQKYKASDTVVLGRTGIKTSRLAVGTGRLASPITPIKPPSASTDFLNYCSMGMTRDYDSSTQQMLMAAIRMWPRH